MKKKNVKEQAAVKLQKRSRGRMLSILLVLAALGISCYLLHLHFQLEANQGGSNVCSAVFGANCEDALRSSVSVQFGIPLAGWGIAYFAGLLTLLLLGAFLRNTFAYESSVAAFAVSAPAAIVSVVLLFTMLFGSTGFCPFCATIHAINFILVFVLKRQTGQPLNQILTDIGSGLKYFFASSEEVTAPRARMVAMLAAALVGIACLEAVVIKAKSTVTQVPAPLAATQQVTPPEGAPAGASFKDVQNLMLGPEEEIPVGPQDAVSGSGSAPVQIVIFSDFQCPACRNYAPQMSQYMAQYGSRLQVVYKHFPLDRACNPVVDRDMHIRACEAAQAAEAARKQGKFWEYHDALFGSDLLSNSDIFRSIAGSLGLDLQQFEQDRQDESTKAKVRADIDLGIRVGVNATPTLFLNHRRIMDIRPDVVRYLIDQTLKQ